MTLIMTMAKQQIDLLETSFPNVVHFIQYLKKQWLLKAGMRCVGNQNILHAMQVPTLM
jgi:hypothetical protein